MGKEMHEAMTSGSKLPTVTAVTAMDSKCVKGVKKVIIAMSAAEPKERMALKDVLRELEKLATGKGLVLYKRYISDIHTFSDLPSNL